MLSNAYFLAKFRFDTAENEPAKKLQNFANFPNFANPNALVTPFCSPAAAAGFAGGDPPASFASVVASSSSFVAGLDAQPPIRAARPSSLGQYGSGPKMRL